MTDNLDHEFKKVMHLKPFLVKCHTHSPLQYASALSRAIVCNAAALMCDPESERDHLCALMHSFNGTLDDFKNMVMEHFEQSIPIYLWYKMPEQQRDPKIAIELAEHTSISIWAEWVQEDPVQQLSANFSSGWIQSLSIHLHMDSLPMEHSSMPLPLYTSEDSDAFYQALRVQSNKQSIL